MIRRTAPFASAALLALSTGCSILPHGRALYRFECCLDTADPAFARMLAALTDEPLVPGNRCDLLENGAEIFPSMLEAIRRAQTSVNLEMYIFKSDSTGVRFARAIEERSRAGLRCRVMVDGWGSRNLTRPLEAEMRGAGVEFERFRPLLLFRQFKHRTHRKILVLDGRVAFVGGEGFDERWEGDADAPRHWHEAAVRVEGPGAARFQRIFSENWIHRRRIVPSRPEEYPETPPAGEDEVMAIKSSFGDRNSASAIALGMFFQGARRRILIEDAYFIPNSASVDQLAAAARRGVDVEVIVPGRRIDTALVRPVSRATYGRLLQAGVRMFEYRPTMMHAKTMTVDGLWSTVGSINIDNRSFLLNDEANATVRSAEFAGRLETMFRRDRDKSDEVTLAQWNARPWSERLLEGVLSLFEPEF